jgi:hypothetical protein
METLLNALWVAICAALLFTWRSHWLSQIRRRVHADAVRQSFIGLVCLLALLFPAISLSDDLHPVVFALPDTKSSIVAALSSPHSTGQNHSNSPQTSATVPVFGVSYKPLALTQLLEVRNGRVAVQPSLTDLLSGRAPPAVL